jgi:hypothetical protein
MRPFRFPGPPRRGNRNRPAPHPSRAPFRSARRRAWGTPSHLVLALAGLLIYFAILWFGVVVIGDNATRSALMAGLIVLIAATGYVASRQPAARDE